MPNQYNFRSDITTQTDSRFIASRVVKVPDEGILLEQLPASFGYDSLDNIEIHFYTVPGNLLITSAIVRLEDEGILKSHVVSYSDGTFKNYIRVDLTKLFTDKGIVLIPGDYKMVMNFFSDEIGRYDRMNLYLQDISESRTEVQLAFADSIDEVSTAKNENDLYEFISTSFDKATAVGVDEKIFKSGVELNDSSEGLTYENIVANIEMPSINQTYDNTIARVKNLGAGAEEKLQKDIEDFLEELFKTIREEIVIKGDRRIQEDEFRQFIVDAVNTRLVYLQSIADKRISIS